MMYTFDESNSYFVVALLSGRSNKGIFPVIPEAVNETTAQSHVRLMIPDYYFAHLIRSHGKTLYKTAKYSAGTLA